jgi:TnpA family transposase
MSAGKRLTILSKLEIDDLYEFPQFNNDERQLFFDLDDLEIKQAESRNSMESRLHFILQLGYFKCKSMFFEFSFVQARDDVRYVIERYFPKAKIPKTMISPRTRLEQYSCILRLLGFENFDESKQNALDALLKNETKLCVDPKYLFNCVLEFLDTNHTVIPGYSTLQDIIGKSLTAETQRLEKIISQNLPASAEVTLSAMLEENDEQMYGVTLLKRDAKGFNTTEMAKEIKKQEASLELFKAAQLVIPKLEISEENIRYYGYLVDYYTADRLNELPDQIVQLYLLCYVFYRFEKINDNLVHGFIYHLNNYKKDAKVYSKNAVYEFKVEGKSYVPKIGKILDLFTDEKIIDSELRPSAFKIVAKEKFPLLKAHVTKDFDEEKFAWDYYKTIANTISRNLRPLVKMLDFCCQEKSLPLMKALTFLKKTWSSKKSLKQIDEAQFPKECVSDGLSPYLYDTLSVKVDDQVTTKKVFNVHAYEFMVYSQLANAIESGLVFINNSYSFKSLAEDLIPDWQANKDETLKKLNNPMLNTPIKEQLQSFKNEFDSLLLSVNQRIDNGENKQVTVKQGKVLKTSNYQDSRNSGATDSDSVQPNTSAAKTWTFTYPKKDEIINNPFFEQLPKASLNQVLRLVNKHCNFMKEFTHLKSRYSKAPIDESAVFACIIANATNYGIYQMATISDIGYSKLSTTLKNYIRLETLKNSNNLLNNGIAALPIFKHWNLLEEQLIAALDGRKVQTRIKHILARHSSKYFGQKRGIVSYSLNLNHMSISGKIISPNSHESHHAYDLIYNSLMPADWYCGDTHSINQLNSSLLRLINTKFTPHIKKIVDKAKKIGSFNDPDAYSDCLIKPDKKYKLDLIEEEWDSMQHIYASLLMRETSQSVVVSKLSSHKRTSLTRDALWEYDKILMSMHILKFIDDPDYQQAIRGAQNRIEGYHQLVAKIGGVNGGKFRGTTEAELAIWNECCRFVANCIIYYSGIILSKIYQEQEKLGNTEILEIIKRFSPIAWCHIILDGFYQFKDVAEAIDLEQMISNLVFDFDKVSKDTTKEKVKAKTNSNDASKTSGKKSKAKPQTQVAD